MALGANLGDPLATLRAAGERLRRLGTVVARSSLYRTAPVGGPSGQPDYWNAVVALEPSVGSNDPAQLLGGLHAIEGEFGRTRRIRWAPRTLDLDLLAYGDRVVDGQDLVLPHPRMLERAFVLVPLLEVAPEWRDPRSGTAAAAALERLDRSGVTRSEAGWEAG